ncbi:MAG: AzlC family ABC transporter permease [Thermodesulfobacteriota bacterium]|nr:AzlC family ABC transporter permease [Thermodesulfobacteriota bacterium]
MLKGFELQMNQDVYGAIKAGLPIFIGYFPAALAFGILSKTCMVSLLDCFLFSALVFAGASQFIALNLLVTGMGFGGIVLTTLLVNFRHFLMSGYLATKIGKTPVKYIVPIAFGITDEVFSILSFKTGKLTKTFIFILELSAYSAWVSGTLTGYILGGFLPDDLTKSMGVALYALLVAILMPEIKKSSKALVLAVSSALLNTILVNCDFLPAGWSIIVCILTIAFAGMVITNKKTTGKERL